MRALLILPGVFVFAVGGCFDFSLPDDSSGSDATTFDDAEIQDAQVEADAPTPADSGNTDAGACVGIKRVFVSSTPHDGAFGGVLAADTFCQGLANAASAGGTWKAYLSTEAESATARMTGCDRYRMDGKTRALSYFGGAFSIVTAPVVDVDAAAAPSSSTINSDEKNMQVASSANVWTGSRTKGLDCSGWQSSSDQERGYNSGITGNWLSTGIGRLCNATYRVYCFEQ